MSATPLALSNPSLLKGKANYIKLLEVAKLHTSNLALFRKEIDHLFEKALTMVGAYNELKNTHSIVVILKPIALPSENIRQSYGKKLGYVQAIIRYFTQQITRYLTLLHEGENNLAEIEKYFELVNHKNYEHDLVGMLQEYSFDDGE